MQKYAKSNYHIWEEHRHSFEVPPGLRVSSPAQLVEQQLLLADLRPLGHWGWMGLLLRMAWHDPLAQSIGLPFDRTIHVWKAIREIEWRVSMRLHTSSSAYQMTQISSQQEAERKREQEGPRFEAAKTPW